MSADRKQRWAARLARRHTRNNAPAPKAKTPREKREPRALRASPTVAAEVFDVWITRAPPFPSPALIMAAAALSATKARTEP